MTIILTMSRDRRVDGMTYFTDSPFERMMVQKPEPVRRQGSQTPTLMPGSKCYGCVYGRDRLCAGVCLKKVLAAGHTEGAKSSAEMRYKNGTGK